MLDQNRFLNIVEATPLVSIDLVIRNEHNQALLGKRLNRPAQGFWFVPGGRIRKNERIQEALTRIALAELGVTLATADLLGVFDHIYPDNFYGRAGINTHYVVLGYGCKLAAGQRIALDGQHSEVRWWGIEELLASPEVHENTRRYFRLAPADLR